MFVSQEFCEAEVEIRAEEARKLRLEREAEKARREESKTRPWRWRVEPGMEGVFQSLMGWLVSSQRGEVVEVKEALREGREAPPATVREEEEAEWAELPLPCMCRSCYT